MEVCGINIILSVFCLWLYCTTLCQGHPHEEEVLHVVDQESHLYYHLLDHYVKELRPAANATDAVKVNVKLNVLNADGPDSETGLLKLTVFIGMSWHDPRLKWNTSDYSGLTQISLPSHQVWQPELTPLESEILNSGHGPEEVVRVSYKGDARTIHADKIHIVCNPSNVARFPSDVRECELTLITTAYLTKEIKLVLEEFKTIVELFQLPATRSHGEWMLIQESTTLTLQTRGSSDPGSGYPGVRLVLTYQRTSGFYWSIFVIPASVLAFLTPMVFILPPGCEIKSAVAVMITLGEILLLIGINQIQPPSSSTTPYIATFCLSTTVLSGLSALLTIILQSLISCTGRQVPNWLKSLCFGRCGIRRLVCLDDYSPVGGTSHLDGGSRSDPALLEAESLPATDQGAKPMTNRDSTLHPEIARGIQTIVNKFCMDDVKQKTSREWHEIVRALNRMLFVLFLTLFLTTALALLSQY